MGHEVIQRRSEENLAIQVLMLVPSGQYILIYADLVDIILVYELYSVGYKGVVDRQHPDES